MKQLREKGAWLRWLSFLLLAALLLSACGGKNNAEGIDSDSSGLSSPEEPEGDMSTKADVTEGSSKTDALETENRVPEIPETGVMDETEAVRDTGSCPTGKSGGESRQQPQSGTLTAGEWNDNHNWEDFKNLAQNQEITFPLYGLNPLNRLTVHVVKDQRPVKNIPVVLLDQQGEILWEAVSDYEGCAYVFYNVTEEEMEEPAVLRTNYFTITELEPGKTEYYIEIPAVPETSNGTDVMFLFDTTGSMDDELAWLQKEFISIANAFKNRQMRFSVNFYRDYGDDYVTDPHPFTEDISTITKILDEAGAEGGGDYEEAVDTALEDAILKHEWNKNNVKLLFLVLDAPPHENKQVYDSLYKTVKQAASLGIHIIPVSASGADSRAEFLFRTFAVLTGGTYTFLTDDSGVGDSHLEPSVGNYNTELLKDLIIRLIQLYNG